MNQSELTYGHRNSLLTKMRTYRMSEDALYWQDDDKPEISLPYAEITSVEAQFAPSRVQENRYLLRLHSNRHEKVDITNTSYKGIGHFEERNESFVPFVRMLHQKIATSNASVVFKKGSSWAGYVFAIVVAFALIAVLVGAGLFFLMAGVIWIAAIKLAILIFLFPRLLRYIKRNKPAEYNPLDLPDNILPALEPVA